MTKRKLKGYVLPSLYLICITFILMSMVLISKDMQTTNENDFDYVTDIVTETTTPVMEEETIIKPFTAENVTISKSFYDKNASSEEQEKSLIYYENTYLQNSGVIYSSNEEFEVVSVLDGTIIDIKQDEILNTVVYVSHNNNLTTIYYGLKDVNLKVNDIISQGDIIGTASNNKFCEENTSFLFEVNYSGQVINPETFYTMNIAELN